uniref:Uncharacterized protein n=1 Tax=Rhizophora mucronata TaxID=61149 RepID=A0A2P2NTP8_RHIMU
MYGYIQIGCKKGKAYIHINEHEYEHEQDFHLFSYFTILF